MGDNINHATNGQHYSVNAASINTNYKYGGTTRVYDNNGIEIFTTECKKGKFSGSMLYNSELTEMELLISIDEKLNKFIELLTLNNKRER